MKQIQLDGRSARLLFGLMREESDVRFAPIPWLRWAAVLVPAIFVTLLYFQPWVEPRWLFLDTIAAVQISGNCCHVYYGMVSNLGIMLWTATAAVCLFAALVLRGRSDAVSKDRAAFALIAGVFTGWLALDDAFLVHERVFPALGLPQSSVLLAYAILGLLFAFYARRIVFQVDYLLFFLAGGFLATSMVIDHFHHGLSSNAITLEDGSKFIGICCWSAFHIAAMVRFASDTAPRSAKSCAV